MEEMEDDLRNQLIGLGFPDYQIYDLVMKLKGTMFFFSFINSSNVDAILITYLCTVIYLSFGDVGVHFYVSQDFFLAHLWEPILTDRKNLVCKSVLDILYKLIERGVLQSP